MTEQLNNKWYQFMETGRSFQSSGEDVVPAKSEVRKVLLWGKGVADNKDPRDHVTQPAHFTDNKNSYSSLSTSSFLGNDLVSQQI